MIPIPTTWLVAGVVAVTAVVGVQTLRLSRAQTALAQEQAGRAADREAAASAARAAADRYRDEERRRADALMETVHAAAAETDRARADAAAAAAAGSRLRQRVATLAAACGRGAAADPGAAASSAPAADAGVVLAELLERLESRGRELAELADRRGIAGAACERFADSLTPEP